MQANYQSEISNIIPYDLNTVINQIYQYKCFEVNINRVLLLGDNKLSKVCLINGYWFNHWKKVANYQVLQKEIDLNIQSNNMNFLSASLCNIFQNINSVEKYEVLDKNIENFDIKAENTSNPKQLNVDWEEEFDVISPELWNLFAPQGNINQNTNLDFNLEFLSNDSKMINISDTAIYVLFWNNYKNKLGKIILKFENGMDKQIFTDSMKNGSFRLFYKAYLIDIYDNNIKEIFYNEIVRIKCLDKSEMNLPSKNPYKTPLGLTNIQMTCYMNSALQSLFNVKNLTNYLISLSNVILQADMSLPLLKAYLKTILNLSRRAEGSKRITEYAPRDFFNTIKNENEFNGLAGDSYDVIRHFLQKMHEQMLMVRQEANCVFDKYIINNPVMRNNLSNDDIANLNNTINSYSISNKSIIANLFYFMERSITKCSQCHYNTSNFNVQMSIIFAMEDIRKWKYKTKLEEKMKQNNNIINNMGMNANVNMNCMGNNFNNIFVSNNLNNMNVNNINNNMVNNINNNINMNNNMVNNFSINNNMNMNNNMNNNNFMNNMNNNNMNTNGNNNYGNLNGGMNGQMNMSGSINPMGNNMNPMGNNMNPMGHIMNQMGNLVNINMPNNMNIIGNNANMVNMNTNPIIMANNINNNQIMINNMMMNQNMFMNNNIFADVPVPTSVDLIEAFQHYEKDNMMAGENMLYCQKCKKTCGHIQSNHFYTLPEIMVINFNRGKGNIYNVGATFPETIDLANSVQTKLDSHKYRLICIITHIGPHGTGGHYIAFCYLEDKKMWFQFNDSIVSPSSFDEASKFGDTYILFYKRI